jgi:hypothetical protein
MATKAQYIDHLKRIILGTLQAVARVGTSLHHTLSSWVEQKMKI